MVRALLSNKINKKCLRLNQKPNSCRELFIEKIRYLVGNYSDEIYATRVPDYKLNFNN